MSDNNIRGSFIRSPDFGHIAQAFGATGVDAENEAELRAALIEGMQTVKSGRIAIVNAVMSR